MTDEVPMKEMIRRIFVSRGFIVFFGMIAPIICVALDPIVFQDRMALYLSPKSYGFLEFIRVEVFTLMIIGILALLVWMAFKPRSSILVGILYAGSLVAFIIGIVILPLSIIGLFIIIGLFGFTPFLTGFAFFVAANQARRHLAPPRFFCFKTVSIIITVIIICVIPVGYHLTLTRYVDQNIKHILAQDNEADDAVQRLKDIRWRVNLPAFDKMVSEYQYCDDEELIKYLSTAYSDITGESIEDIEFQLFD